MQCDGHSPATPLRRGELTERLLGIVERTVGQGEALPEGEWEALRTLAAGHPRSLELVEKLQQVVTDCTREIDERKLSGGDLQQLRQAIVRFVRETVCPDPKGAGQAPGAPGAANRA